MARMISNPTGDKNQKRNLRTAIRNATMALRLCLITSILLNACFVYLTLHVKH